MYFPLHSSVVSPSLFSLGATPPGLPLIVAIVSRLWMNLCFGKPLDWALPKSATFVGWLGGERNWDRSTRKDSSWSLTWDTWVSTARKQHKLNVHNNNPIVTRIQWYNKWECSIFHVNLDLTLGWCFFIQALTWMQPMQILLTMSLAAIRVNVLDDNPRRWMQCKRFWYHSTSKLSPFQYDDLSSQNDSEAPLGSYANIYMSLERRG